MLVHPLKVAIARDGRPNYQVAAAALINPSALSKIIAGKIEPTEAVKNRLALELGCRVTELFPDAIDNRHDLVPGDAR